jgi:membrane protein required for colicin V production
MTSLDWVVIAVLVVSCLLGAWRGLIREVFSVAGWVTAVVLALRYSVPLAAMLPSDVPDWPALRVGITATALVVVSLFTAAFLGWLFHKFIQVANLSGTDRALGAVFGVLRGVLIVFVAVYFTARTAIAQEAAWKNAVLLRPFDAGVRWIAPRVPASITPGGLL